MSITPLDLVPGDSLGPFQLGSLLFNVLNHVRSYRQAYPSAKLLWDDENPSTTSIHLILSKPPLHLSFDSISQRLVRIEVNPTPTPTPTTSQSPLPDHHAGAWVSYRGKVLRDDREETEDVVRTVRRVLGPTYGSSNAADQASGEGDQVEGEEMLSYPGVALGVTEKGSRLNRIILTPLPTPTNNSVPVDQAWLDPVLPESPLIAAGDLSFAEIELDSERRKPKLVRLNFHSTEETSIVGRPVSLEIGETTSEDILCELGTAVRTFWKEDDRMSIHNTTCTSSASSDPALALNPYFLSYPHLGLTLLVQPSSSSSSSSGHFLTKIVLHSNLPGQLNFGRTSRCRWKIVSRTGAVEAGEDNNDGDCIGGEEKFERIKEVLKGSAAANATSRSSSNLPQSLPIPVPLPTLGSTNGTENNNSKSSKKKNKSKPATTTFKEFDLLGSSYESSVASSSPVGRVPSPLRNDISDEDKMGEEDGIARTAEGGDDEKPMILDRTASIPGDVTSSAGRNGGVGSEGVEGRTTEIHGFPGIAFEVTKSRDVETVWLF